MRRQYGIRYDGQSIAYIDNLETVLDTRRAQLHDNALDEFEKAFQGLWQVYFEAVNIKARNNEKNHLRQLPKRY